ncbi:M50 family metallopeptidase [Patescibacteria group bacterium]|nr:M50 family metallopeptidase [Patescibacteria group bacterium]
MTSMVITLQNVKTFFARQKDENLVWYLLRVQNSLAAQFLAFFGFLVMFYLPKQSLGWALIFIFSMWVHEYAHAIVYRVSKIQAVVRLLFPLGAVAAPANKEWDALSDKLPHWNLAWLTISGPWANVLLMVLGTWMASFSNPGIRDLGANLVSINFYLAVFNVLPIWKLDGGLFWGVVLSSVKDTKEKYLVLSLLAIALVVPLIVLLRNYEHWVLLLLAIYNNFRWVVIPMFFATGIWHAQGKDDPKLAYSKEAMTNRQIAFQVGLYMLLVGLLLVIGSAV